MNSKIHTVKLGYSNAFLIEANNSLSLVDTGLKNNQKKIERLLQEKGFELKDIKQIIITHAHPDHVGSLAELVSATNAGVWVHEIELGIMRGESLIQNIAAKDLSPIGSILQAIAPKPERFDFTIDRELKSSEQILTGFEVVHLPGHSMGQIGLWQESSKTLIGGDVMMRLANRLTMPIKAFSVDWEETKKSILKVGALKPDSLYLGHGKPYIGNAQKPLEVILKRISKL